MASSLVSKRNRNCWRMSPDDVQPIKGSTRRGCSGSKSRTQALVFAWPDCMAVFDGL
jgi:hypothetical protein